MNRKSQLALILTTAVAAVPSLSLAATVYIAAGSANAVVGVDADSHEVVATYPAIANPHGLAAAEGGEYLVAGSLAEDQGKSQLYIIHPAHGHVMSTVTVEGWTHHQVPTPDGRYVLSTHPTRDVVSLLDVDLGNIVATIPTGATPNYAAVSADGTRAYVSNSGGGTITEIDLENRRPLRTLEAGPKPEHMVLGPAGRSLYVTNGPAGTVSEVSLNSGQITRRFEVGKKLHGVDLSEDGERLFVTTRANQKLVAIDLETGEQQALDLSPDPYHLETIEGTGHVYVSSRKAPLIWVVDQKSLEIVDRFELPAGEGHQMTIGEEG
jgi:hypothetical protein